MTWICLSCMLWVGSCCFASEIGTPVLQLRALVGGGLEGVSLLPSQTPGLAEG